MKPIFTILILMCSLRMFSSENLKLSDKENIESPVNCEIIFNGLAQNFCQNEYVVLPTVSSNGISGTWNTPILNTSAIGSVTAIFTPSTGNCPPIEKTFTITGVAVMPTFTFPTTLCTGQVVPFLYLTSDNGIQGTWSPAHVNNQASGTYIFTPNAGQCAAQKSIVITVATECTFRLEYLSVGACETNDAQSPRKQFFTDLNSSDCIISCQNSIKQYSIVGNTSSITSTTWNAIGGEILSQSNTFVNVKWTQQGAGSLSGSINLINGDVVSFTNCHDIIPAPTARFTSPGNKGERTINACKDTDIYFENESLANGGNGNMYYFWDFGDGTYTTEANPVHSYSTDGVYNVTLTVRNGCGCYGSTATRVVISGRAINIACATVSCEKSIETYSINDSFRHCENTRWSVDGGDIINMNPERTEIQVLWNDIDSSGFGTVTVDTNDCLCTEPSTIRIPIVTENAVITGPAKLCPGEQQIYRLPQWPTTDFQWRTSFGHADLNYTIQRNEIALTAVPGSGPINLECVYYNTLLGCGGTAKIYITVSNDALIAPNDSYCVNTLVNIPITDIDGNPISIPWKITDENGIVLNGTSSDIQYSFNTPGTYLWSPVLPGSCQPQGIPIVITPAPAAPTNIYGPSTNLCPNQIYQYSVDAPQNGYVEWQIENGSFIGPSTGNTVSVKFLPSNNQPYAIKAKVITETCESAFTTKPTFLFSNSFSITGNTTATASCSSSFSINYNEPESITWSITNGLGGNISGQNTNAVTILWNNVTTPTIYTIQALVVKCGTSIVKTFDVTVYPRASETITSPTIVCYNDDATFTVNASNPQYISSVTWNFGDGTTGYGMSVTHPFPEPLDQEDTYNITATINYVNGSCTFSSTKTTSISVIAPPAASISPVNINLCNIIGGISSFSLVQAANQTPGNTITWFKSTSSTTSNLIQNGGNTINAATIGTGNYFVRIQESNGCFRELPFQVINECPVVPPAQTECPTNAEASLSYTVNCNTISANANFINATPYSYQWQLSGPSGSTPYYSNLFNTTVNVPGNYSLLLRAFFGPNGTCVATHNQDIIIPYVAKLESKLSCNPDFSYSVKLTNTSLLMPDINLNYCAFSIDNGSYISVNINSAGIYEYVANLAPGVHTAKVRISDGTNGVCESAAISFTVLDPYNPDYIIPSTACKNEEIPLNVNTMGVPAELEWTFSDGSNLTGNNIFKTFSNSLPSSITLTITNAFGCTKTITKFITITNNNVSGTIQTTPAQACIGTPMTLSFSPFENNIVPTQYTWYKGNPSYGIIISTAATVQVTTNDDYYVYTATANGCEVYDNPKVSINFLYPPSTPQLSGPQTVCSGNEVTVTVAEIPNVLYKFFLNNSLIQGFSTNNSLSTNLDPGTHIISCVVRSTDSGNNCESAAGYHTIVVEETPEVPEVSVQTILCAPSYAVTMRVTNVQNGVTYVWNDGQIGATASFNRDGPYQVVASRNGCSSSTQGDLPVDVDKVYWVFPTGCMDDCSYETDYILGPYGEYRDWSFLRDGQAVLSGTGPVENFDQIEQRSYAMFLYNGKCEVITDELVLSEKRCQTCPGLRIKGVNKIRLIKDVPCTWEISLIVENFSGGNYFSVSSENNVGFFTPSNLSIPPGHPTVEFTFTSATSTFTGGNLPIIFNNQPFIDCEVQELITLPPCGEVVEPSSLKSNLAAHSQSNPLEIAPNPAQTFVNIRTNLPDNIALQTIFLFDALGRVIKTVSPTSKQTEQTLLLDGLEAGLYVIQLIYSDGTMQQQKLIIKN